jgi:hypothetical protein
MGVIGCLGNVVRCSRPCTPFRPLHRARNNATALYCSIPEVGSNVSDGHDLGWSCDVLAATLLRRRPTSCVSLTCQYQRRETGARDRPIRLKASRLANFGSVTQRRRWAIECVYHPFATTGDGGSPRHLFLGGRHGRAAPTGPHTTRHPLLGMLVTLKESCAPAVPECAEKYPVSRALGRNISGKERPSVGTARPSQT